MYSQPHRAGCGTARRAFAPGIAGRIAALALVLLLFAAPMIANVLTANVLMADVLMAKVLSSDRVYGGTLAAQTPDSEPLPRMGAFQCLICADGGALIGILSSHGRSRQAFEAFAELCVSDYRYIDGQLYVRFKLEDRVWPDDSWYLQASSWEAVCLREP